MRRRWWGRAAITRPHDRPIASLHELRRVHRRLRRWGRALPYEEFAGWRLDRDAPRRTWREVRRRRQRVFMYGMVAAVVLTVAVTNPLGGMPRISLSLASLPAAVLESRFMPVSFAKAPTPPDALAPVRVPLPLASAVPEAIGASPELAPTSAAVPEPAPSDDPDVAAHVTEVAPELDYGIDGRLLTSGLSATVASLDAVALSEHALAASVIVAGRIESVEADTLLMRVELALKGTVADLVYIAVPADAEAGWGLQPGTRLLAYLAGPDEAETDPEVDVSPLLRPAGRGALVGLSPLTSP